MNVKRSARLAVMMFSLQTVAFGQFPYGDRWYQNPLGFEPVKLHTSMGFILPAVASGVILLLTEQDAAHTRRISFYNESGISWGYKYPHTLLIQNNVGFNVYVRTFLSLGADFGAYFPFDNFNGGAGGAVRPFARFYPFNNERWKLYFESGGGILLMFGEFPKPTDRDGRLGTRWNGTTKYGIGSEFSFSGSLSIFFGMRHAHISNGNAKGVERNPSHDSNGFFIGISSSPE